MSSIGRPDAKVLCSVDMIGASGQPEKTSSEGVMSILAHGAINRRDLGLGPRVEHTRALVACVVVLGSPPSHIYLIVIIRLCKRAILVRLHHEVASSGTR